MECYFCGCSDNQHDKNCPKMADLSQRETAEATWNEGYEDGRNRREAQSSDPTYAIGFTKGDAAADYRENVSWSDYYE